MTILRAIDIIGTGKHSLTRSWSGFIMIRSGRCLTYYKLTLVLSVTISELEFPALCLIASRSSLRCHCFYFYFPTMPTRLTIDTTELLLIFRDEPLRSPR